MIRNFPPVLTLLILAVATTPVFAFNLEDADNHALVISSAASHIDLEFDLQDLESNPVMLDGSEFKSFEIRAEGVTVEYGKPLLPLVSRFVIVPPDAGLGFEASVGNQRRVAADLPPAMYMAEESRTNFVESPVLEGLYPAVYAEMSAPIIIRGVRLVKVTTYPVQYDADNNEYIYNEQIQTRIVFTDDEAVNPAFQPVRRNRSQQFLRFIRDFAINGDEVGRDDPDRDADPPYIGHYLVVANENCLEYAAEFIEWRRKSGYKVDIITPGNPTSTNAVKNEIQAKYDEYLDDGIDPFENLMLIGDLFRYDNLGINGNWRLESYTGNTVWPSGPPHADYIYACLEGNNDSNPDVGLSRWAAGDANIMGLVSGRTMMYEATPRMGNTAWFTRGAVYSQHWGNSAASAWHISIHTNVRWAVEVLEQLGYDDIDFYEQYNWDQNGGQVGPFVRDRFNEGCNVLLGRAENYFWRTNFSGVNDNTVFPIRIVTSGHGEWASWSMWRGHPNGSANHLKGPVATTFGWGGPATASMSSIWMEMVSGIMNRGMNLGWGYVGALNTMEKYFSNYNWRGHPLYLQTKTDVSCYGDPGIQPWRGVPQIVEAEYPEDITADTKLIQVYVIDENEVELPGARVTLYVPGDMPDFDRDEYADYDDMLMITRLSDEDGSVRFVFDNDNQFEGDVAYITVTGEGIRPFFGEIDIRRNVSAIDLAGYTLTETEGNDDDIINPGEVFSLELTARNLGNRNELQGVTAAVGSLSPWVEVDENLISFGDIAAGENAEGDTTVTLRIHASCPDGASRPKTKPLLSVDFRSGNSRFRSAIELNPSAPDFVIKRIIGGDIITTDRRTLDIEIKNVGSMDSPELDATLQTKGIGVSVVREIAQYPGIASGRYSRADGNRFLISGNMIAVPGSRHQMLMILETEDGFIDSAYFDLQVDEPRRGAPQGPDGYGYICFDDTDDDWDMAPEYNWIEINPRDDDADYEGEECDFDGSSPQDVGESQVVDMGMQTQFYGKTYHEITICTNGFIAVGDQEKITNFQNWPLDRGMGGGAGMIAPFWDYLDYNNNSRIFYYYDEDEGRFIVQWHRMRHHSGGNRDLNFQVILYDRDVWVTETGDQNILFQYKTISNVRGLIEGIEGEKNIPYASIGISSPDGTTGINYGWGDEDDYPITSEPLSDQSAILFATSPRFRSGYLFGRVTDLETSEGIDGAMIATEHGFTALTDEDGYWHILEALAEVPFDITAYKQGYNELTYTDRFLAEDDTLEINFILRHPEFVPSHQAMTGELGVDEEMVLEFEIENSGNGPLLWSAREQLRGDANADPWEHRRSYPVGDIVDDSWIQCAIFVNDHFYVSAKNSNGENRLIHVLNRDGELVRSFNQEGDFGNYGIRGMTWDGELIWAVGQINVYGMTTDGEIVAEFVGPHNPSWRITWDPENQLLWICSTTTNIIGCDRDGNEVEEIRRNGLRIYGLSYYPQDPDGCSLYLHTYFNPSHKIYKINPAVGDTNFVVELDPPVNDRPAGSFITNQFDVYSWVMVTTINSPDGDMLDVWQVDARRDWFVLDHYSGVIDPGNFDEFTLSLNAFNLPEVRFEADLVFSHNATGGEFIMPVTLDVLGGLRDINLELEAGWNLKSINVEPENTDITDIFEPLVDEGNLIMIKNGDGAFYYPEFEHDGIGNWDVSSGYLINVNEEANLALRGSTIPSDRPIPLEAGWNMKAYYPRVAVDAIEALAGIVDYLIIAKDGVGNFYLPEFDFSNMGQLSEGNGYMFKVNEDIDLVYQVFDEGAVQQSKAAQPEHFRISGNSDRFMPVLLQGDKSLAGMELGVFGSAGNLAGSGVFGKDGRCGVAVWGDISSTKLVEGVSKDEFLTFIIWDGTADIPVQPKVLAGDRQWNSDEFFVGEIFSSELKPLEFGIHGSYPNPTNGPVRLLFGIKEDSHVRLAIFDLNGRMIASLVDGSLKAGNYNMTWDTSLAASGVYLVRLESDRKASTIKTMVIK